MNTEECSSGPPLPLSPEVRCPWDQGHEGLRMRRRMAITLFAIALQSSPLRESWAQDPSFTPRRYPELLELMRDGDVRENAATSSRTDSRSFPMPLTSNLPQGSNPPGQTSGVVQTSFSAPAPVPLESPSTPAPLQAPGPDSPNLLAAPLATESGTRRVAYSELQVINVQMPIPASPPQSPNLTPPPAWQTAALEDDIIAPPPSTMVPESAPLVPSPEDPSAIPPAPTVDDGLIDAQTPMQTVESMPYFEGDYSDGMTGDVLYEEPPFDCPDCVEDGVTYRNLFPAQVCQEPDPLGRFLPFGNFGIKVGNDRVITGGGFFLPLWQSADSLIFTELRGNVDDRDSGDGYIGLGYRTYMDPNWIFGVSVYADLMGTNQDNFFAQGQLSLELMSLNWDFRLNGYGPESTIHGTITERGISNGTVVTRDFRERAYSGFEAEIGHRFMNWGFNDKYEVRWFVGGYSFGEDSRTFPSFAGPRGRLEMRVFDLPWCGQQSRLEVGAEVSYDRVRDEQFFGYFRVRIPFGRKDGRPALDPLRRRMVDTPVHRVD